MSIRKHWVELAMLLQQPGARVSCFFNRNAKNLSFILETRRKAKGRWSHTMFSLFGQRAELFSVHQQPVNRWLCLCDQDGILHSHHLCYSNLIEIWGVPDHTRQHCCAAFSFLQAVVPSPNQEAIPGRQDVDMTEARAVTGVLREQIAMCWQVHPGCKWLGKPKLVHCCTWLGSSGMEGGLGIPPF